jgi:YfiR/HmsC-like
MLSFLQIFFISIVILCGLASNCRAAPLVVGLTEDQIKTAYLYNFAKFVEWPDSSFISADSPLKIAVFGDDPIAQVIQTLQGKAIGARLVEVVCLHHIEEVSERCHILYLPESQKWYLSSILKRIRGKPILFVSDMIDFARKGGVINFLWVDNNIRFVINLFTVEQSNLKISSKLASLATTIIRGDIAQGRQ